MPSILNSLLLLPILVLLRYFFSPDGISLLPSVYAQRPGFTLRQPSGPSRTGQLNSDLRQLATLGPDDYQNFNRTLEKILVPRVSGTPGSLQVREFIVDYLQNLNWNVELDSFEDETPFGRKPFTNIIATLNPNACRRIVLACHYDSKYFPDFEFLAATDSAVPCTMMLEAVRVLDKKLKAGVNDAVSLQLVFFDGEEAFREWSARDSLYGSRHLAAKLDSLSFRSASCGSIQTELERIQTFILLDLLGEASPQFCPFFSNTKPLYNQLTTIERTLNQNGLIESRRSSGTHYFSSRCLFSSGGIEDDHVPFQRAGIPILHLIPVPFPTQWHQRGDDGTNLHHPTINNLNKILRLFLVSTLQLS